MKRRWQRMVLLERVPESGEALPRAGLARLEQIIGDPTADPPIPPLIPISKSTWWAGVRSGRFPPADRAMQTEFRSGRPEGEAEQWIAQMMTVRARA